MLALLPCKDLMDCESFLESNLLSLILVASIQLKVTRRGVAFSPPDTPGMFVDVPLELPAYACSTLNLCMRLASTFKRNFVETYKYHLSYHMGASYNALAQPKMVQISSLEL